ncbi:MAG: ribulose-phosphate 3-epimerase [bacterium]|nr:ribulose-phosphate 3-epimerase [bacterium]
MTIRVIPAILEKDIAEVQKKLDAVSGFAELAQIDIADGKFVDNMTIRLEELKQIKTTVNLEIHLMVENPRSYFAMCQQLKAYRVFWHYEADSDIEGVIAFARQFSFKKGLALNPESSVSEIKNACQCLDAVMLMGVAPGAQGQVFIPETVGRVSELKKIYSGSIGVDGGVSEKNIKTLVKAGASDLVVGSALFGANDVITKYKELVNLTKLK